MTELLTAEGKKYARYVYLSTVYANRIPLIGKYAMAFINGFVFSFILKEGAKENARRKKAEMSGMRRGVSFNGRETAGEVREVRIEPLGVHGTGAVAERVREEPEGSD